MNKRIVVLESFWSNREDFIVKLEQKLTNDCAIVRTGAINIMNDIIYMLDWEKKKDQSKVKRLARELYSAWEECDDKLLSDATKIIDSHVGEKYLYIMGAVIGDAARAKLEEYYPNQVVYFTTDFKEDPSMEKEVERLLNIEQLRLKTFIK